MDSFYIFQYRENFKEKHTLSLVIFCSGESIDSAVLKDRLREFFRTNSPPKKIYVVGGSYLKRQLDDIFKKDKAGVIDVIPNYLRKDGEIRILVFDSHGQFQDSNGKQYDQQASENLMKEGIFNIFRKHGGQIEAPSEMFHYVFPSGKHSPSFIRAGNVLVNGPEIFFIAIALLKGIHDGITHIYCDTSSINALAYVLIELKRRLSNNFEAPAVHSFGSYEKFENFDFKDSKNSLFLISASTSGRIVKRLLEKHPNIKEGNIYILFYLSHDQIETKVICNLTVSDSFPQGMSVDKTSETEIECEFCQAGSYTVKVTGDIFQPERPKINTASIVKSDAPDWLSRFMQKFYSQNKLSLIRCFYGEDSLRRFEIFFKTDYFLNNLKKIGTNYFVKEEFLRRYRKTIIQHVPAQLKYIVYLNDSGSKIIAEKILANCDNPKITLYSSRDFVKDDNIDTNQDGAVLVVCSCLVTGNNLLYVNKYLRRFQNMTKSFFILFSRMESEQNFEFIRKNIGQGEFGISTNHFMFVDKINTSAKSEHFNAPNKLVWSQEEELFKNLLAFADSNEKRFFRSINYIKTRLRELQNASDENQGGLVQTVFLKNPVGNRKLKINKNFAFFEFDGYHDTVTQADIYFTIASILNNLRTSPEPKKRKLIQEEQLRTLIDPDNFIRFDDGIIQAAILRAATHEELNFKLSPKHSALLAATLNKMVDSYHDMLTSEALVEFLLALALNRLRINDKDLVSLLDNIDRQVKNNVLLMFSAFIRSRMPR